MVDPEATLNLFRCWKLNTLPASISQLSQLDKDSREHVAARCARRTVTLALASNRACYTDVAAARMLPLLAKTLR
jgi:hypothetical protein